MDKNKKKYVYYSGHASNISRLSDVVSNLRHAAVLDRFAFFSLNSTFTLPRTLETEGWFCIKYEEIGRLTGYKERTIKALVKIFEELRLIEKTFHFIQNSRRACLRITDKTKALLNVSTTSTLTTQKIVPLTPVGTETKQQKSLTLNQKCTSESAKNALAYNEYREKEKDINIITRPSRSAKQQKPYNTPDNVQNIFDKVGERLEQPQKAKIWGAVLNLKKQHGKTISNLSEFIAWISFSIINAKHQLKNTLTFDHQLNALMKIARSKEGLQCPRGFHNHWDVGIELKAQDKEALSTHQQAKKAGQGAKDTMELFNSVNSFTSNIGYVVTKKAKELWGDDGDIAVLKSKRASLVKDINCLMADNNALNKIFANEPVLKATQTQKNNARIEGLKTKLTQVDKMIENLKADSDAAKAQEWQPLYA